MSTAPAELMHNQLAPALKQLAPHATWRLSGPVSHARKCDIFKITNDQKTHTLALKVYRDGKISNQGPQNQFNALKKLAVSQQQLDITAPRAHAFIPSANAIVMDWVEAPPLYQALWRRAFSSRDRLAHVQAAAIWLRQFHETSGIEDKTVNFDDMLSQVHRRLEQNTLAETDKLFAQAVDTLRSAASGPALFAPHAKLHGDYTPSNVLIQNEKAVGIDIWGWRDGTVFEDAARMLTYLSINTPFAFKRAALIESSQPSALLDSFINGYGADIIRIDTRVLWLTMLYQHMRRWLVFADWKKHRRSQIKTKLELERVKRLTSQTLAHLDTLP